MQALGCLNDPYKMLGALDTPDHPEISDAGSNRVKYDQLPGQ